MMESCKLSVESRSSRWALSLIFAIFALSSTWTYITKTPVGVPPDEMAHLTYLQEIAEGERWIPDYAGSVVIDSQSGNYLNHPPLYYSSLGLLGRTLGWTAEENYRKFRILSTLMVVCGLVLWIWIMFLWGWSSMKVVAVAGAAMAIPMFPYLAGSVNNDNLAYLGVATVLFSLSVRSLLPRAAYYVGALGVTTVMLTKATAAVFVIILMLTWIALRWKAGENLIKNRDFRCALAAAGIACALYYIPVLVVYGELFPKAGGLYEAVAPTSIMSFPEYTIAFASIMFDRLSVIISHQSFEPLSDTVEAIFYVMVLIPVVVWLVGRPASPPSERRDLSDAFMVGLMGTLLLHLGVAWNSYQVTGLMSGIQPRYYSYALPGMFFFCFPERLVSKVSRWGFFLFAATVAACLGLVPVSATWSLQDTNEPLRSSSVVFDSRFSTRVDLSVSVEKGEAGSVDQLVSKGSVISASGWGIDTDSASSSSGVLVTHGSRLIGTIPTGSPRPDVSKSLGSPSATHSGFNTEISGAPADLNPCTLGFFALQNDGTLRRLRQPKCL